MKIVVIGGSGLVGSKLVEKLRDWLSQSTARPTNPKVAHSERSSS
jgi:uncharacterized protein YbjT (DUF2867 family)